MGPPPEKPSPWKKPKKPSDDGTTSPGKVLLFVALFLLAAYILSQSINSSLNVSDTAVTTGQSLKPLDSKPARVVDNEASSFIVYPPTMISNSEEITTQMSHAEGEWQKAHPGFVITNMWERGDPSDYHYCWIVHYQKK